jgi:uncharacterized protein YjiS (DUF1127 family)
MIGQLPAVERLDVAAAPAAWRDTLARVATGEAHALLERDGRTLAALISAADYRLFVEWDERWRTAVAELQSLQQAFVEAFADVSPEEIEAEIAKAIKEVRTEANDVRRAAAS